MAIISIVPETPVTAGLQKAVANQYTLTALTQNIHWNLTGSDFFQLHQVLGAQYDTLFDGVDVLAERIRALSGYVNANLSYLDQLAAMPSLSAPFDTQNAIGVLVAAHDKNVRDLTDLSLVAGRAGDLTTQNMLLNFIESEQKVLWQLRAYLK